MNQELPDVQARFRKGRGTRDQIAIICWIIEKAREFQKKKKSTSASLTTIKSLCRSQQTVKFPVRANSLEKALMLGKIEGSRRRGQKRIRWLDSITDSMDMSLSKFWKTVRERERRRAAVYGSQGVRHD